jgi:hypothetical protein
MEKLFTVKVSDNADDEYWHNEAVNGQLSKYESWFDKTNFKRGKDYKFLQQYGNGEEGLEWSSYLELNVYVDIKCKELKMLYKLRWK